MGKTLLIFMLLSVKLAFGQVVDDFSDGNFTANPTWMGQTTLFNINAAKQLQSSLSSTAQTVNLVTASNHALNTKWEFFVQLNFDPSTTNQARIYLIADKEDLSASLNGYFVQIGESGSADSYDLYRQSGTTVTKIIDGAAKTRANANLLTARIKVTRNDVGKWELFTDITGGKNYKTEGNVTDNTFAKSNWFGVSCKYTATRSDGFIFDDFSITELIADVTPPSLVSVNVIDENTIDAVFSEGLTTSSALLTSNYILSNLGNPTAVTADNLPNIYRLTFANGLSSGVYTLTVNNVKDLKGNQIAEANMANFAYIKPYTAKGGDVVLNEIFADPTPQIGLPNAEYIELWNTTDEYILLKGWKYADLTSTYTFLADTLKPKEYMILCANADVNFYKPLGKTIGLSPWPSLNNDKDGLKLIDQNAVIIDEVTYTDNWYKDAVKKQGGYSLELIDPKNKCKGIQNWIASNSTIGGTPGQQNSVYQNQMDSGPPKLLTATIIDELTISLTFNKFIDSLSASSLSNYSINNGIGNPASALPQGPLFTTVELKLSLPITRGIEHTLTLANLKDCAGNSIDPIANTAKLFLAKEIKAGDILISEALINPRAGGVDFIEIYNSTDQTLDLKELRLANVDAAGNVSSIRNVSTNTVFMPAKTYWVLSSNAQNIKLEYNVKYPNQLVQMVSLPSYNNDKGNIILLTDKSTIDRFDYHEGMHLPLMQNVKGVSLERVSLQAKTNEVGNFKSAAAAVGYATPTYRNSQEEDVNTLTNKVSLAAKTFSPDGDGFEDLLQIDYRFINNGNLATINIYTDRGVLVRKLQRNTTIATEGNFIWDGLNDSGQLSKIGIYIIKFDAFALNGKTESFKQTCVLAAKL